MGLITLARALIDAEEYSSALNLYRVAKKQIASSIATLEDQGIADADVKRALGTKQALRKLIVDEIRILKSWLAAPSKKPQESKRDSMMALPSQ